MADRLAWELPGTGTVHAVFSDVGDGDLSVDAGPALQDRRRALCPHPWTWLHQVHGAVVVRVDSPGEHAGAEADGSVTDRPRAALAVQSADCAPVLLWATGPSGIVLGAAHAGWRGLCEGVLGETVSAMADLGAVPDSWCLGPCISPSAYEFDPDELDRIAARLGPGVRGHTASGAPALDLRAAVAADLAAHGVTEPPQGPPPACTARSGRHFSWRAGGDSARQAAVIWWEEP